MDPPVAPVHSGWHVGCPHPFALKTYMSPSYDPTYARPFATAGEDSVIDSVPARPTQVGAHTAWPHPFALNTSSLPSFEVADVCEPMYTQPPATVGLSTIYRRWPTKQDLVRASLCCDRAAQKYAVTGDPRADVKAFLTRLAEDLSGDGAQTLLGFLASLRSDPEIAAVYRQTAVTRMHEHLKSLLAAELGDDFPDLDLRATAAPAILIYTAAVCGQPIDAEAMATRLTELLFAPLTPELRAKGR